MPHFIFKNVQLSGVSSLVDVEVIEHTITKVQADIPAVVDALEIDMLGALLFPGFVETHIHLDKSCLLHKTLNRQSSLTDAISQVSNAKRNFTFDDVYDRGKHTLERAILNGTNRIRTHVETDPRVQLVSFNAIKQLKRDYEWALELQICVFPQEGLINDPGTDELLVEALASGADVLGGCPYTDSDPASHIQRLFQMASEFDVDLDFHLDFDLDASWNHIDEVIRKTHAHGWQGRVCVGHMSKLSMLPPKELDTIARALAKADIAVTVLPSTDLYLMGRDHTHAVPRGVAPIHKLKAHGVRCSISTNNFLNPFTPFGDASLIRMANLYANVAQIGDQQSLYDCFQMVSQDAAQILGLQSTIEVGQEATFVAVDCESETDAVATIAPPLWGMKRGRFTFERPKAFLST
jgi:cytosine deaminase